MKTRVGEITLNKPQFREMPFEVFERYSRVEKALINAVSESLLGVSTRRIRYVVSS